MTRRPKGILYQEGHITCDLAELAENTFRGHIEAEKGLHDKLTRMRDENNGQLAVIYYVGVGPDGK